MSSLVSRRESEFITRLIIIDDYGFPFELDEALVYYSAILGRELIVEAGFKTDYASIPLGLWNILPKVGPYDRAAVLHDWLYQYNGVSRLVADQVFKEAMQVLKVGGFRLWAIYSGVRIGGWLTWNKYRAKDTHL